MIEDFISHSPLLLHYAYKRGCRQLQQPHLGLFKINVIQHMFNCPANVISRHTKMQIFTPYRPQKYLFLAFFDDS